MPSFMYTARDVGGLPKEGVVQAATPNEVVETLRQRGLTPTFVDETFAQVQARHGGSARRISSAELAALCWQLGTMVDGGVAITTALEIVTEDTGNPHLKSILYRLLTNVSEGRPFSDGLKGFPRVFSRVTVAIAVAGESSGNLGQALRTLAEYFESRDRLIKKIRGALTYPLFVLILIVTIITAIMVFVVPRFRAIFNQVGSKLPAFTRGFMRCHEMLCHNWPYLIVGACIAIGSVVFLWRTKSGHRAFSRAVLRLPLFGRLVRETFVATFCTTTATLLEAGVPVLDIFDILRGMTSNDVIGGVLAAVKRHIVSGSSIALSMGATGFFPNMVVKMTQVGEESGSLAPVLRRTSSHYERRIAATIDVLTGLLEPVMIVTIGAVVLVVVIALYLPIFSMSDMAR
jgi:type II secretory pathway component PulF